MKIIDKNYDFYDYLQGIYPDKTVTFDRRKSFILTKNEVRSGLNNVVYGNVYHSKIGQTPYALLQVCNRFWLFKVKVTSLDDYGDVEDYTIDFVLTWTNYNVDRELFSFHYIELKGDDWFALWDAKSEDRKRKIVVDAINRNNYKKEYDLGIKYFWHNGERTLKDIPLLKASGFAEFINPLDIYLAIEEYFSLERTAAERRESIGLTNDDKITNHGFDTKISFRGGQKKKKRKKG